MKVLHDRSYKNGRELLSIMNSVYGEIKAILMGVGNLRHDKKMKAS